MATNRWRVNQGGTFQDPLETIRQDPQMKFYYRNGANLVHQWTYENKTVGTGAGISLLHTFVWLVS